MGMRIFIGLPVPDAVRDQVARSRDAMRAFRPDLRWVGTEGFHVTLAFLGEVDGNLASLAGQAVARAVADAGPGGPIPVTLPGLLQFPPRGPLRVLAVDLADPSGRLAALWAGVNGELERLARAARLVPPNDDWLLGRPFSAHLTLARAPEDRRPGRWHDDDRSGGGPAHGQRGAPDVGRNGGGEEGAAGPRPARARDFARFFPPEGLATVLDRCVVYRSELRRGGSVYTELRSSMLSAIKE